MIKLSVSENWLGKQSIRPSDAELPWVDFDPVEWSPSQVAKHLTAGRAICVAYLSSPYRKHSNYKSAQIIGIDIDSGDPATSTVDYIARHDEFARKYAFLIYATASSTPEAPRTRIMFALDYEIAQANRYKELVLRMLAHYSAADPKCKDEVRIFFGSKTDDVVFWPEHVLPLEVVDALPLPETVVEVVEESDIPAEAYEGDGSDHNKYIKRYIAAELAKLATVHEGSRNSTVNEVAFRLGRLAASNWADQTRSKLESLVIRNTPTARDFTLREATRAAKSGFDAGMNHPLPRPGWDNNNSQQPDQRRPEFARQHSAEMPPYKPLNAGAPNGLPAKMPSLAEVSTPRKQAVADVVAGVKSGKMPIVRPVANHIKAIEPFGGQAYALDRGNMAWLVGLSGGGKTIFWESMITPPLLNDGYVLATSREWQPGKLGQREMQRKDETRQFSVDDMRRHVIAQEEIHRDIPVEYRTGRLMDAAQIAHMEAVASEVNATSGDVIILQQKFGIDGFIHYVREFVEIYGEQARGVIMDYIQLEMALDVYRKRMDIVDGCFYMKDELQPMLGWMGVPIWVASQVTKESAKAAKDGPYILTGQDGKNLRDDPANLALAITLQPIVNENGTIIGWKDVAVINVDKNSEGSKGIVAVGVDFGRLRWIDEPITIR